MKLASNWYKAASTWFAGFITLVPNIAGGLIDLAPYLGPHGQKALTIAGILFFIARVYPQKSFENE